MSKLFGRQRAAKPHLTQGSGGLAGELGDLRSDLAAALGDLETEGGYFRTEEFTDLAAASTNAIKTAAASANAIQAFTAANFDGTVGDGEMIPPRNVTLTTTAHADIDAVAVVVTGKVRNSDGALVAQTDTITLTDGGGVTDAGTKAFSLVETVTIPAQGGAGGTVAIGFGLLVGLAAAIKTRAGLTRPIREIVAGTIVTNGVFTTAAAKAPYGTYAPNTAPNGSNDYAITYEVDPAV